MKYIREIIIGVVVAITIAMAFSVFPSKQSNELQVSKVTYIASMTCGHCASFHKNTLPEFLEKYVNTNEVEFVFVHFPLDRIALRVSAIVESDYITPADKEKLITELFEKQRLWANIDTWDVEIKKIVAKYGMNESMFNSAINDRGVLTDIINKQNLYLERYKINSTPSFIFDDKVYTGNM